MTHPADAHLRVAMRYLQARDFFEVGDAVFYGKYKNKKGIIKSFGADAKGNPTATIEPVPKGRKDDKVIQLFRFWHMDLDRRMTPSQAAKKASTLRVYHASRSGWFDAFDPGRRGDTDDGLLGLGYYFSTDPNIAQTKDETLITVDVRLRKPLRVSFPRWGAPKSALVSEALGLSQTVSGRALASAVKSGGYDSVILDYSPIGYRHQEVVVYGTSQIRIVGTAPSAGRVTATYLAATKAVARTAAKRPYDALLPEGVDLPFGRDDDGLRSWAKDRKDTLVWGAARKDHTLPLSDLDDVAAGNLRRHGLEELKADILAGGRALGGPGQRILIYVAANGRAEFAEGNHRVWALRELRDEGEIPRNFPTPVELHYKGNSDLEERAWLPRSKQAARPIRLDNSEIKRLLDRIYTKLGRLASRQPIPSNAMGAHRNAIVQDRISMENVLGVDRHIHVVLLSVESHQAAFVLGGGFGHLSRGPNRGDPIIILNLNGKYSWTALSDPKVSRKALRTLLMHELTHAVDKVRNELGAVQGRIPTEEDLNLVDYYNDPHEVRAFMRELFEAIAPSVRKIMDTDLGNTWGLGGAITRMLRNQNTWTDMQPHISRQNRNRILKGLVTAFQDEFAVKRVATLYLAALPTSAKLRYESYLAAFVDFEERVIEGRGQPRKEYKNRPQNYIAIWRAFNNTLREGRRWAEYVVDNLAFPKGKAKKVEMAARAFSLRREPKDLIAWYDKNEKRLLLLTTANRWPLRSEAGGEDDLDRTFRQGPFQVINTVHATGKALERVKGIIDLAIRKASKTGIPGFAAMARGDLYLVGQIGRKRWAAWYMEGKDVVYIRPSMRGVTEEEGARHLVHELGHRYWAKKLNTATKSAWKTHHITMTYKQESGRIPEVGEVLPMEVNRKKVRVQEWTPTGKAVLVDIKTDKPIGQVPRMSLYKWMQDAAQKGKFPSIYASGDAEEHFCEALSLRAFGRLSGKNEEAYNQIVLGGAPSARRVACAWMEATCP